MCAHHIQLGWVKKKYSIGKRERERERERGSKKVRIRKVEIRKLEIRKKERVSKQLKATSIPPHLDYFTT